ncbi:fasciclin domain-containing protein [Thiocapsa marina]|uniref:Beta-Ig-H3/fasciclin n=1 Tax=Thiocapsa marina 5811 TaxID=768671 RepID=F9U740_9GAMM|nr:fasciclin domain-containing protein [Thiocapsa marina]EGV20066.1 beta-Ig-H3/fasciclin [Thiocapsa marina 5811]
MSTENAPEKNPWTIAVVLAVALGPLTALALGSKYADEETRERARAGLVNATPSDVLDAYDTTRAPGYASEKTLGDITGGSAIFSQLQAAIEAAGSKAILEGEGPYTVFAPSNEAFARVPEEQLAALLADPVALQSLISAHIAPGRLSATEMMQGLTATNLAGETVPVGVQGNLKVGDATVSQSIVAKNGIVHVIDRVML